MIELQLIEHKDNHNKMSLYVENIEDAINLFKLINKNKFSKRDIVDITVIDYPFTNTIKSNISIDKLQWLLSKHNKEGLKKHILFLQSKKVTERDFWKILEDMNWIQDHNFNRISKNIKKGIYGDIGYQVGLLYMFENLKENLKSSIANNLEKNNLSYSKLFGYGDDSFDDLCSNIIGMGKDTYTKALRDVVFASKCEVIESFAYSFNEI